jgi:hypothetical protein
MYILLAYLVWCWADFTIRDMTFLEGSPSTRSPAMFYGNLIFRVGFAIYLVSEIFIHWT